MIYILLLALALATSSWIPIALAIAWWTFVRLAWTAVIARLGS